MTDKTNSNTKAGIKTAIGAILMASGLAVGSIALTGPAMAGPHDIEMRGPQPYYHGHKGSKEPHHGWHKISGWWFPPAAFAPAHPPKPHHPQPPKPHHPGPDHKLPPR